MALSISYSKGEKDWLHSSIGNWRQYHSLVAAVPQFGSVTTRLWYWEYHSLVL
jgi:hypothetical protein